ncbi:MAG: methyltransferase [Pseudomonadota bacterium]
MPTTHLLNTPFSTQPLHLQRPYGAASEAKAWDNADRYLLNYCHAELTLQEQKTLVADDTFGTLTCALAGFDIATLHHSATANTSATTNLRNNHLATVPQLEWTTFSPSQPFDVVLLRLPKSIEQLIDYCHRLRPHLVPGATLIGAAMDKYLSKGMLSALTEHFGPTHPTLGWNKARLTVSTLAQRLPPLRSPTIHRYPASPFNIYPSSLPGVFSATSLDIGTRFFLENFSKIPLQQSRDIADLACGNGVLGLVAASLSPQAQVHFFDDSSFAVASAELGVAEHFPEQDRFSFHHRDGLGAYPAQSLDTILLNPPFHSGGAQDAQVAQQLFWQAARTLRPDGELWVVGNRHLGYHIKLKRYFPLVQVAASNRKFTVFRCHRETPLAS